MGGQTELLPPPVDAPPPKVVVEWGRDESGNLVIKVAADVSAADLLEALLGGRR